MLQPFTPFKQFFRKEILEWLYQWYPKNYVRKYKSFFIVGLYFHTTIKWGFNQALSSREKGKIWINKEINTTLCVAYGGSFYLPQGMVVCLTIFTGPVPHNIIVHPSPYGHPHSQTPTISRFPSYYTNSSFQFYKITFTVRKALYFIFKLSYNFNTFCFV